MTLKPLDGVRVLKVARERGCVHTVGGVAAQKHTTRMRQHGVERCGRPRNAQPYGQQCPIKTLTST